MYVMVSFKTKSERKASHIAYKPPNKHRIVEKEKKRPWWVMETQYKKKWINNRNNNKYNV